jgi:hypothetical protein
VFLAPVFLSAVWQRAGRAAALRMAAVAGGVALAVTLPFYAYDPSGFSPIHTFAYLKPDEYLLHPRNWTPGQYSLSSVVNGVAGTLPLLALAAMALTSAWFAFRDYRKADWPFLRNCAVILAIPCVCGIATMSFIAGTFEVGPYANHGLGVLFFGSIAAWQWAGIEARDAAARESSTRTAQ